MAEAPQSFQQSKTRQCDVSFREETRQVVGGKTSSHYTSNTVQFTVANGFFKRRRGRPPSNRYVQVHKNLNLPPQAVFTSFKLEKKASASTLLFPWFLSGESDRGESGWDLKSKSLLNMHSPVHRRSEDPAARVEQNSIDIGVKLEQQQKSVIRPVGIYFPGSTPKESSEDSTITIQDASLQLLQSRAKTCDDLPEDLSIRRSEKADHTTYAMFRLSYLQMVQLINTYYQTLKLQLKVGAGVSPSKNVGTMSNFSRHHYSEDCRFCYDKYRQRQTHNHCLRLDCQYGFCDRSRLAQHAIRHMRLNRLLSPDFKRFQPHTDSGETSCIAKKDSNKQDSGQFH